jgi:sarcosine oxidase
MPRQSHYDAIVVGVGGMGSATALELARRGQNVLALERFNIPHSRGSSHGYSRVVSRSFYELPAYMPIYDRACELWEALETEWGAQLFYRHGSLTTGRPGTEVISTAKQTAERFDVPHTLLDPAEAEAQFPGYVIPDDHEVLVQPTDGYLVPRDGVRACVELAHQHGAEIHARTAVRDWTPTADGVRVSFEGAPSGTDTGATDADGQAVTTVTADALAITAGPWTPAVVEPARDVLEAERQVLGRFQPAEPGQFTPEKFPVSAITTAEGQYSAFPVHGSPGVKLTRVHHLGEAVDPDTVGTEVTEKDESVLRWFGDRYLTGGTGPTMRLETCLYTNTPDGRFIVDTHPAHPQVCFAAGFSGHGYKFCPVIGEILSDLVLDGQTDHDIAPFELGRF